MYMSLSSEVNTHCSDLWRRVFIWYDGKINPCDTDYKSNLSIGFINDFEDINKVWRSNDYESYRRIHLEGKRSSMSPCNRCVVI